MNEHPVGEEIMVGQDGQVVDPYGRVNFDPFADPRGPLMKLDDVAGPDSARHTPVEGCSKRVGRRDSQAPSIGESELQEARLGIGMFRRHMAWNDLPGCGLRQDFIARFDILYTARPMWRCDDRSFDDAVRSLQERGQDQAQEGGS